MGSLSNTPLIQKEKKIKMKKQKKKNNQRKKTKNENKKPLEYSSSLTTETALSFFTLLFSLINQIPSLRFKHPKKHIQKTIAKKFH